MTLKTISLKNCAIPDSLCESLFDKFITSRRLINLDLSENEISDKGLEDVCKDMIDCKKITIKSIKFNGNSISDKGAIKLMDAIMINQS